MAENFEIKIRDDGVYIIQTEEYIFHLDEKTHVEKIGKLIQENEQLKQELFDSEKEYFEISYEDNPVRRNDKIQSLKEEFKERFGRDFE